MHRRFNQLDSIRGLAAITVFMSHIALVSSVPFLNFSVTSIFLLPLNILAGRSSYSFVNFFFVLSGFVLFLLFTKGRATTYGTFIIKRFFRLYIPYIVAVIISISASILFSKGGIKELSGWFNLSWVKPLSVENIIHHVLMIGNFNTNLFNNVIWSLVQEMRVSLILPIIAYIITKIKWNISILICICLSFVSGLNNIFHWETNLGYHTSYFATLQIVTMFILGGLLGKHLNDFMNFFRKLTGLKKILLLSFAVCCLIYNEVATVLANYLGIYYYGEIFSDYAIGFGSFLVILISLASKKAQAILMAKPLLYLGNISYSLYLYHLPILFSLIHIFYHAFPLWIIFIVSVPLAIFFAHLSREFVEKPASMYGNVVAEKFEVFRGMKIRLKEKRKRNKFVQNYEQIEARKVRKI